MPLDGHADPFRDTMLHTDPTQRAALARLGAVSAAPADLAFTGHVTDPPPAANQRPRYPATVMLHRSRAAPPAVPAARRTATSQARGA